MDRSMRELPQWELNFRFEGGLRVLAFTATVGERWRESFERLRTPDRLADWLTAAELSQGPLRVEPADLLEAWSLREAIYSSVTSAIAGRRPTAGDVDLINRWGAEDGVIFRLSPASTREVVMGDHHVRRCLAQLAREAVDLLTDESSICRVRECAAPDCALLFFDASRPGRRRWCLDGACGTRNRARQRRSTTIPAGDRQSES